MKLCQNECMTLPNIWWVSVFIVLNNIFKCVVVRISTLLFKGDKKWFFYSAEEEGKQDFLVYNAHKLAEICRERTDRGGTAIADDREKAKRDNKEREKETEKKKGRKERERERQNLQQAKN